MNKLKTLFFISILFVTASFGQQKKDTSEEQLYNKETIKEYTEPVRATFYSALVPGLGQVYNNQFWKVPIVYGAIAITLYYYLSQKKSLDRFRDAYKRRLAGFYDDEFYDINKSGVIIGTPDVTTDVLISSQKSLSRDVNLAVALTFFSYILNIIDASVSAHLKKFNLSDDLSFNIYSDKKDIAVTNEVGLEMTFKF